MTSLKHALRVAWQVGLLTLVSMAGNWLTGHFHWRVPGNVVGLCLMLLLLLTRVVRIEWVDAGGSWMLGDMLLFFIPAAVGVIQYKELLVTSGLQLLLVIVVSTAVVMACTGAAADRLAKYRQHKRGGEGAEHA